MPQEQSSQHAAFVKWQQIKQPCQLSVKVGTIRLKVHMSAAANPATPPDCGQKAGTGSGDNHFQPYQMLDLIGSSIMMAVPLVNRQ